jgi:SAM-dependent methyltransferase
MPRLWFEPADGPLLTLAGLAKRILLLGRTRRLVLARIVAPDVDALYAGEGESLAWLARLHGASVEDRRPISWAGLLRLAEERDRLLYVEINRLLRPLLPAGGFFTLPWIRFAAQIDTDAGRGGKKLVEATYGRKVRQQGFTSRLLSGRAAAETFHRDFYLPYVRWRFGGETHPRSRWETRAAVRNGFVLQILQGELPVAAAACGIRRGSVTLLALGLQGDYPDLLHRGALSAVYYELFRRARESGLRRVDLLRSRPHSADGVSLHKKRFGARPETDPWPHALLAIYPPATSELPAPARDLLVEDPRGRIVRLADLVERVMGYSESEYPPGLLDSIEESLWRRYNDLVVDDFVTRRLGSPAGAVFLKTDLFEEALGNDSLQRAIPEAFVGMDLSPAILRAARRRSPDAPLVRADVRQLPFAGAALGGVISTSTLDHFRDPEDLARSFNELGRVLRPGGRLLLTLDNPLNPLLALRNALPHSFRVLVGLTPYYVGYTCSPARIERLLCEAGFEVRETAAILHFPRALAALLGRGLRLKGPGRMEGRILGLLRRAERLRRWPTRWFTGHYVAVVAAKRSEPF